MMGGTESNVSGVTGKPFAEARKWEYRTNFPRSSDTKLFPLKWGYLNGSDFIRLEVHMGSPARTEWSRREALIRAAEDKLNNSFLPLPAEKQTLTFSPEAQATILNKVAGEGHETWSWEQVEKAFGDAWPSDADFRKLEKIHDDILKGIQGEK